jgi:hypothetical protein
MRQENGRCNFDLQAIAEEQRRQCTEYRQCMRQAQGPDAFVAVAVFRRGT